MTDFGKYLEEKKIPVTTAAKELKISRAWAQMFVSGTNTPSAFLMAKIEAWTSGAVTMQSWIPWMKKAKEAKAKPAKGKKS